MRLLKRGTSLTPVLDVLDGLMVVVGLLVAVKVLLVVLLLVDPQHPFAKYYQVTTIAEVPADVWPAANLVRVVPGSATATADPWAFITFRPSSRAFVIATAAASATWWVCIVVGLLQLRQVFRNMSATTPFPRDNSRRIRTVGWAILGTAAANLLIDAGMIGYLRATTTVAGRLPTIPTAVWVVDFPLGTILAGVAVLILAEIFRVGADLQDEQALTI
jgi:hypothetical protein